MLRNLKSLIIAGALMLAPAVYGENLPLIEIAPAHLTLGKIDLRAEVPVSSKWTFAGNYSSSNSNGAQQGLTDRQQLIKLGTLYYPMASLSHSPFFGFSMAYQREDIDHATDRPRISYFFPRDGGDRDTWTNEVTTLAAVPELGYRVAIFSNMTASVRFSHQIPLATEVNVTNKEIIAKELDPESFDQPHSRSLLGFHLGMVIR